MKKWLKIPINPRKYKGKTGQKPATPVNSRAKPPKMATRLNQKRYLIMIL
jgi:hypothetical protein